MRRRGKKRELFCKKRKWQKDKKKKKRKKLLTFCFAAGERPRFLVPSML